MGRLTPSARLPRGVRIAYGASDLGASLSFVAVNTWLLYALVHAGGVGPAVAAGVFVAGRVLDAVTDPLMGWCSDRVAPRHGRLVFLRWGALPLGASLALLFAWPARAGDGAAAAALVAFALFSLLYTVVQVPTLALTPELARTYRERTALTSWRVAFGTVASLAASALPPALVLWGEGGGALGAAGPAGWTTAGVVLGSLTAVPYLVTGALLREPARPPRPRRGPGPVSGLAGAWRAPGMRTTTGAFVAVTVGLMVLSSALPFFLESALRLPGSWQTPLLGGFFGVGVAAFPAWSWLADRVGKRRALAFACSALAVSLPALAWLAPVGRVGPGLLVPAAVAGVALAGALMMPWAMLPDVVEMDAAASGGPRREGVLYALFTFAQKVAGSAGVFATGLVTVLLGYEAGLASQEPHTVAGLRAAVGPIAGLAFAAAAVFALRVPIDASAHERARATLAARGT